MTETETYTLERFIDDARQAFAASESPLERAEPIAAALRRLLGEPGWLEERLGLPPEGGLGTYTLHDDTEYGHPEPGFKVLAHVYSGNASSAGTGLHDHGPCFVVYGVYAGEITQRKFFWAADTLIERPHLEEYTRFVQQAGDVAYFLPGEIHETLRIEGQRSIVIRVTSQDLGRIWRHRYDLRTGKVQAVRSTG
jgi:predicted metal-dependent enzyme (double-stranded beta helix superfamily)